MRVLALDVGERRIGLAVGDTAIGIAFPHEVLECSPADSLADIFQKLLIVLEQEQIELIVVGHPGSLREKGTEQAAITRRFADDLEDFLMAQQKNIRVELINEAFSTQFAERKLRQAGNTAKEQKGKKDAVAAAAFLQTFLEK